MNNHASAEFGRNFTFFRNSISLRKKKEVEKRIYVTCRVGLATDRG